MTKSEWQAIRDLLGESMHTGFRKGLDNKQAMQIHALIKEMGNDWTGYVDWVFSALHFSIEGKEFTP